MRQDAFVMGVIVAILCAVMAYKDRWFLEKTRKGQRLVSWFGAEKAPRILLGLAFLGILFGVLLASGVIRPIQW